MIRRRLKLAAAAAYIGFPAVLVAVAAAADLDDLDATAMALAMPVSLTADQAYLAVLDATDRVAPELWNWVNIVGMALIAGLNLLLGVAVGKLVRRLWGLTVDWLRRAWSPATRAELREARRAWRALPMATRREVARSYDRRERHPDPVLTELAERWARLELAHIPAVVRMPVLAVLGLALIGASVLPDEGFPHWLLVGGGTVGVAGGAFQWFTVRGLRQIVGPPSASRATASSPEC